MNSMKNGKGTRQDYAKSVHWLRKAAKHDEGAAQYLLGLCYRDGEGVLKSRHRALAWFQKAAANSERRALTQIKKLESES